MQNLTTILLLLGSMFMLSNCKDDCADKKTPLKDLHLYVPYSGTEILRFLHNSTDTQFFIGQGMERFYVTEAQKDDYDCPEDHESVRINFKNSKDGKKIIKIEFSFDTGKKIHRLNFNYLGENFTQYAIGGTKQSELAINGVTYTYVSYHSNSLDTNTYVAYCYPAENTNAGLIKIKTNNDTLTLIR